MNNEGHNSSPNNLIDEKSPYLLQHAYNPVNWYVWGEKADVLMKKFRFRSKKNTFAYTFLLSALAFLKGPSFGIVVVGDRTAEDTKKMIEFFNSGYVPNKIVILKDSKDERIVKIVEIL